MKRLWVFFAALAVCTVLAGVDEGEAHDAAALVPVQALVIDAKDGTVFVTADTGDNGRGGNLDAALSDLQSGCAGALFTQTAEHVIVTSRAWYLAPQVCVSRQLRPAAKLYRAMEEVKKPEEALSDLQSGCAGALFAQTAEHVIVTSRAWYLAPQVCVSRQLRPAAKLYRAMEEVEAPEEALRFLQAHPGNLTLSHARAALLESREEAAPVLLQTEGGFRLGG